LWVFYRVFWLVVGVLQGFLASRGLTDCSFPSRH